MENKIYNILKKYLYTNNLGVLEKQVIKSIADFTQNNECIEFVLPSFPGKSPNNNSSFDGVFGYEEFYSIKTLKKFLSEIKKIYKYGAKIYIIHDGNLFTDLKITRSDIELEEYIKKFRENIRDDIISISLLDLVDERTYTVARKKFMNKYVKFLKENELPGRLVQNETLFTKIEFEEQISGGINNSNNQLQTIAKRIAKKSLLIKKGLSKCIEEKYSRAIRLSIHYQQNGSKKIGFKLIDKAINLGSPWFNIIYKSSDGDIILGKKNWFINSRKLVKTKNGYYYKIDNKTKKNFENNNVEKTIIDIAKMGR